MNTFIHQPDICIDVNGLPDPLIYRPTDTILIKTRADYKATRYLRKFRNVKQRSVTDFNLPTHHVLASELTVGDWILLPRRLNLPLIDLTPDQLYLIGFWLAEGHHLKESKKGTSTFGQAVGICLTNTVRTYLERAQVILKDWFPRSASHIRTEHMKNPKHNTKYVLEFRSWDAAAFFYPNFGEYSFGKFIGDIVYDHSGLLPLVCGFIDGDGCQFSKGHAKGRVTLITTSGQLVHQLRQILFDNGVWAALQYRDHTNIKHSRTYWLTIPTSYAHLLTTSTKIIVPEVGNRLNYVIPTSEGFYARVRQIITPTESNT